MLLLGYSVYYFAYAKGRSQASLSCKPEAFGSKRASPEICYFPAMHRPITSPGTSISALFFVGIRLDLS